MTEFIEQYLEPENPLVVQLPAGKTFVVMCEDAELVVEFGNVSSMGFGEIEVVEKPEGRKAFKVTIPYPGWTRFTADGYLYVIEHKGSM